MNSSLAGKLGFSGAVALASVLLLTPLARAEDNTFNVVVDRASVMRAPEGTATIIIGNPLIADATTQRNGVLVVTGKSYGQTNVMLLDATGKVLSETIVNVRRAQDGTVLVQRGAKRESYACTPRCEPVLAIGDSNDSFAATASQITTRTGMSAGKTE